VTSASTYSKVAVTHVVSSGTFVDGKTMDVRFVRSGLIGSGGPPGPTGSTGSTGATGTYGHAGFRFDWETATTDTDQGVGKVWANNGTYASISVFYVDDVDKDSVNVNTFIDTLDDGSGSVSGTILIRDISDTAKYIEFDVTGAVTSASTYSKIAVSHQVSAGTISDGQVVDVIFIRTGDDGKGGPQGVTGATGATGSTGPTGGGLANVVEDGSPQLGGFLDANGNYIQPQRLLTPMVTILR
jgi:hypothetical protein